MDPNETPDAEGAEGGVETGTNDTQTDPPADPPSEPEGPKSSLEAMDEALGELGVGNGADDDPTGSADAASGADGGEGETGEAAGAEGAGEARAQGEDPPGDQEPPQPAQAQDPLVDDPIPDGLKPKTRDRIQGMAQRIKELTPYREQLEQLTGAIAETGAPPEAFAASLEYLRLAHSRNPEEQRQALNILRKDLRDLSVRLGEDTGDPDLLSSHDDLRQAVDAGELDEKHARELALARERRKTEQQAGQQQDQAESARVQAINEAKIKLNAMEATLTDTDPDYQAKRAQLIPKLQPILRRTDPREWPKVFMQHYKALGTAKPATQSQQQQRATSTRRAPAPDQQPMRHRSPAGTTQKTPKTSLEAIDQALAELGQ